VNAYRHGRASYTTTHTEEALYRKKLPGSAIGVVPGGPVLGVQAGLTSGATLSFTPGTTGVVVCANGTPPPCASSLFALADVAGSCFGVDADGDNTLGFNIKNPINSYNGIVTGAIQPAGGSRSGGIDGTELPGIDLSWTFPGNTGMHQTISAISVTVGMFGSGLPGLTAVARRRKARRGGAV
jgi:hypothetical protein